MYKLIKIYSHGVAELTGTQIFIIYEFHKSRQEGEEMLIALYLYNEVSRLEKSHIAKS